MPPRSPGLLTCWSGPQRCLPLQGRAPSPPSARSSPWWSAHSRGHDVRHTSRTPDPQGPREDHGATVMCRVHTFKWHRIISRRRVCVCVRACVMDSSQRLESLNNRKSRPFSLKKKQPWMISVTDYFSRWHFHFPHFRIAKFLKWKEYRTPIPLMNSSTRRSQEHCGSDRRASVPLTAKLRQNTSSTSSPSWSSSCCRLLARTGRRAATWSQAEQEAFIGGHFVTQPISGSKRRGMLSSQWNDNCACLKIRCLITSVTLVSTCRSLCDHTPCHATNSDIQPLLVSN